MRSAAVSSQTLRPRIISRVEMRMTDEIDRGQASGEVARRVDNGVPVSRVTELALKRGLSVDFSGYYQRHVKAA